MEQLNSQIKLYVKRSFSEKMNASFDFIKENWKVLFKYITFLLLPLSLLQAISINSFMGAYMEIVPLAGKQSQADILAILPALTAKYAFLIFFIWIGMIILTSLIYALMKSYNEREGRLVGITLKELRPLLIGNIGRTIKLTLFIGLLLSIFSVIIVTIAVLLPLTLAITIPLYLVMMVPIALFAPVYLFEKISLMGAFKKTFRLGFATWGGIFAILFIMSLIISILQGVVGTPWMVAFTVKYIFSLSETGQVADVSIGYDLVLYLFAILQCFGLYLASSLQLIGLAYQYGHASEVVDSISVESDIDNFEKL